MKTRLNDLVLTIGKTGRLGLVTELRPEKDEVTFDIIGDLSFGSSWTVPESEVLVVGHLDQSELETYRTPLFISKVCSILKQHHPGIFNVGLGKIEAVDVDGQHYELAIVPVRV